MISTTDLSIAVAIASATGDTPQTPPDESSSRHNMHYYQMHHNHHAHQAQSQGHNHSSSHHHHAHLQHLLQHFGDTHNGSPYGHSSRPGSATTPTTVMDDPSGANADTCSSVSSTTIFGARICNMNCRCTNRLLTGIVITILPIAITSTLLFVFMMQKTNLHQYAIYSFVIFCVAFVFPFALFFFTVILNKIYKFYKRGIRTPSDSEDMPDMDAGCDDPFQDAHMQQTGHHHHQQQQHHTHHTAHSTMDHHNHVHLYHDPSSLNGNSNLVYYQPYYFTTMTYHSGDIPNMGVSRDVQNCAGNNHHDNVHYQQYQPQSEHSAVFAGNPQNTNLTENANFDGATARQTVAQESLPNSASSQSFEDSPPCYEMALLCPSVNSDDPIKRSGTALDAGLIRVQTYSPAKESLIKVESIEYKDTETIHLQHSTPSTSRNPSQEEEAEALSGPAESQADDKCSAD